MAMLRIEDVQVTHVLMGCYRVVCILHLNRKRVVNQTHRYEL